MKKLVLILVCAVIMTVFIAFNYLLLDKEKTTRNIENLKYNNDNQSASIEVLGNEIKNSKDKIAELNNTIRTLENNYSELSKTNTELKLEISDTNNMLIEKNELIDKIKSQIDIKPFEVIIKKWVEGINESKYNIAYELYQKDEKGQDISFDDYSNLMKESIKNIKVKEIKIQSEVSKESTNGNIVLQVSLDIKLLKASNNFSYTDGLNERLFSFKYIKATDTWVISSIEPKE